jgi:hypothetical protein
MRWMELWLRFIKIYEILRILLRFIEIYKILRILRQNWNQQFYKQWQEPTIDRLKDK